MIGRLLIICLMLAAPVSAQQLARVVYLGSAQDPYYEPRPVYTGLSLRDRARPVDGARLAVHGARVLGRSLGLGFRLDEVLLGPADSVAEAVAAAADSGALAVLLDLPAARMADAVAEGAAAGPLLFDIRHPEARWRSGQCPPVLLHTLPSFSMLSDALSQYLRRRAWDRILLLRGTTERDTEESVAVRRSLAKFGLTLADERVFQLSNDPRQRELSNVALMTAKARYDVVWVVDSDGEFGRYVPYATYAARPVVGSEGLTPRAWHWTFERYGAPQLNQRFRRLAGREMSSEDWAAWIAVRAVIEGVQRVGEASPAAVAAFVRSDALSLDLYKGVPGNFRAWNGQLRQPILLATHNAVIAVAPVEGFEHRADTLDTLGIDRPESACTP
jgi:ABC transporter substrate binding protein (PQQ-dependent alcohol dehydrogenase system)